MFSIRSISLTLLIATIGCNNGQIEQHVGSLSGQTPQDSVERVDNAPWPGIQNQYFECLLPPEWELSEIKREDWSTDVAFDVTQPNGTIAFTITVATDAPRFIDCYCVGWDAYEYFTREGVDYANVYMDDGNLRTLKAKGLRFATDVHLAYNSLDRKIANRIVESVRPR
ncbi:MAG TPA: hypothetical protein VMM76_26800 [Pirellulaceae bacterium]|nr:hypothetical protein [Pirellulaceae bacterium]